MGDPGETGLTPNLTRIDMVERLRGAVTRPVTLVRAPAGYGKTETLQQFTAHLDRPAAWAPGPPPAADRAGAPPAGEGDAAFWWRVTHALDRAHPGLADTGGLGELEVGSSGDVLADALLTAAAGLPGTTVVVVDEVDRALDVPTSHQLTRFVELLPPSLRLVLLTRRRLPLPTGRWRAQGRVTELGTDDLRFTPLEASILLDSQGVAGPTPDVVRAVTDRAEGWPAGVQLLTRSLAATLAPEGPARPGDPGDDRHPTGAGRVDASGVTPDDVAALPLDPDAADAVVAHTLGGEDPETQRFLLTTSVLGRFSADLCRAVTERPDAGRLLRRADEANLFLVALDDDRTWFRYQRLFAELLRAELDRRHPGAARPLRRRAAAWFAARHDSGAAVQQLSAAGDLGEAFSIVSADPYDAGWGHLIGTDWSSVFPAGWVEGSPERMLHFAALLGRNGQLAEATAWLDRAGEALADHPADHPTRGLLLSAQAMWNGVTMHAGRCEELGLAALAAPVPPEATAFHERVRVLLLGARMLLDDLDGVEEMCRQLDVATSSEIMRTLMAPSFRSHRALRRGELRRAEDEARRVLQTAQAMGIPHHPGVRDAQVALAGARAERGDFDEAERLLGLAAAMADNLSWPAYAALYRSELAGVRAGCSGPVAGLELLADVRRGLEGEVVGPELHARVDGEEAALRMEAGQLDRVGPLVATMLPGTRRDLLGARLALGLHDLPAAHERLAAVAPANHRDRLGRDLVAASVAAAEGRTGDRDRHLLAAGRAGAAEGFATTFLREASPLLPALRRLADGHHELRPLVADIERVAAHRSRPEPTGLSDREAAVLRHLAGAMTHQEIAGELGVSTNTVKSHVRSLYRKLGVQSRAEAVAAAREARL